MANVSFLCCSAKGWAGAQQGRAESKYEDRKERHMASFKIITEKLNAWRRYREAVRELSQLSDHELSDIGISRCDIDTIALKPVAA